MCGENETPIRVYRFENNGTGGPTEDSIEGIIENVRSVNRPRSECTLRSVNRNNGDDLRFAFTPVVMKGDKQHYEV